MKQDYDIIPVPISIRGSDGRYKYVNRAWSEMFSVGTEQALGHTDFDLSLDPLALPDGLADPIGGEYAFRDVYVTTRDRGRLLLELIETRVSEGTDEEGIMCVHQDMTGIGWRMEDLSRSLARSEMRARQSIQHVVRLSREMCEPLERMAAYCDKLEGSQLTEDQRGWLLSLRDNARLLEKHIRRSIDLSVVSDDEEGGVVPARMEPLVGEVCDLYLGMTREKGLTLSMHVGSELAAPVHVDAVKVRQILVNMMDSAVRQARSGDIAVTASLVPGSDRPLCLKIRIGNPRPGTGGTMPKISMGLSHVIIKGLCGMTGGRFETGIAPDGSRLMKVCLRLSPPVSSEGAGR